jgi:hypothetical protein
MWDEIVHSSIASDRPDIAGLVAGLDGAALGAHADDRAAAHLAPWDPVVDPAFEPTVIAAVRSEALPLSIGQTRPGASTTLPVPEATTLVFVGLALAGVASGRKLFKR